MPGSLELQQRLGSIEELLLKIESTPTRACEPPCRNWSN